MQVEAPRTDRYTASMIPYILMHVGAVVGIAVVGFSVEGLIWCVALYYARMFGITAGYHRYFSHRSYKTSRPFQFLLALLGTTSLQKGVLWWAGHHRDHHRNSDTERDIHSPRQRGFWYSHQGWFLGHRWDETPEDRIRDFMKYPELVWLNKHFLIPPLALIAVLYPIGGPTAMVWGGVVSTVVLWHGTFTINSLAHVFGRKRYETGDDSKNSMILALITMGEGWHNNHHYYQGSANQGFFWWEIDLSFYVLKALSWVGIVWDLNIPPEKALRGELRAGATPAAKPADVDLPRAA